MRNLSKRESLFLLFYLFVGSLYFFFFGKIVGYTLLIGLVHI